MSEDIQQRFCATNQNQEIQFTSSMHNETLVSIENTCLAITNTTLVQLGMIASNRFANYMFRDLQREIRFDVNEFGSELILLSGDLRQILHGIPCSAAVDELNACLKSTNLWRYVHKLSLKANKRAEIQNDASAERFAKSFLDIVNGKMEINETIKCILLPPNLCKSTETSEDLIHKIFPNIKLNCKNHQWLIEPAIFSLKNNDVNTINRNIQNEIPGEVTAYKSIKTIINQGEAVNSPT
ncbi:hypothetical protein RF11_10076 [Thelohanellus kitauei]|uniref:ATP-dependent DNA helicase n=1 Tax=Thelohanellus kitauei TaxID=669202 RepID=A0A0C2IY72_THEKT|nr:hypothetical protein RF11_10076 [Thelohanellus kitauei]